VCNPPAMTLDSVGRIVPLPFGLCSNELPERTSPNTQLQIAAGSRQHRCDFYVLAKLHQEFPLVRPDTIEETSTRGKTGHVLEFEDISVTKSLYLGLLRI
jgi:hypothetical protein